MLDALLRRVPLRLYDPLRHLAVRLPRGHPVRGAAVLVLKYALRGHRHHLPERLREIRPIDAPDLSFEAVDSMVMDAVYWLGVAGYEGRVADVWVTLCRNARSVLEIGGNVGLFTVIGAAATTGRYTVVEPLPEVASVLRANLARNGLTGKVEVLEAAVIPAEPPRSVTLNVPDEGRAAPVGAHLLEGVEVTGRDTARHVTVPGLPIAGLAADRDLIKIDAEGIEAELLGAIHDRLLESRPVLLVEVLPEARRLGDYLAALARTAGYLIHIIPEYGSDTIVTVSPDHFTAELPGRYNSKDVVLSPHRVT
jgi:FkbM family methyltransferase